MFAHTVTVINHYFDDDKKDRFKKTVLTDCMWNDYTMKSISNGVITSDKQISVTILFRSDYVNPREFKKSQKGWTMDAKSNLDMVVLGEVKEDIDTLDSVKAMKESYDKVGIITQVQDDTTVDVPDMRKWQVSAKYQ